MKKYLAEVIGTAWLVVGGCGTAVLAGQHVGFAGVALAFGLTVLTMAYAIGHVSGCHLNPAVTVGVATAGRIHCREIIPYISAQVVGAILGAALLYVIVTGAGKEIGDFACNGYGEHSPNGFGLISVIVAEFAMTFFFVFVILGATSGKAFPVGAPIAIGLCLTLVHLVSIPVSNTSVNPARSISQALFVGDWAISQLWVFLLVPVVAAFAAGMVQRLFDKE